MYPIAKLIEERFPQTPSKEEKLNTKNLDLSSSDKLCIVEGTGLVNEKWNPWHCKAVAQLGPNRYMRLADIAKKGKNPETLFSWLLKQEMKRYK